MLGDEAGDSAQTQSHMSADDLNDGFILDKADKKTLAYQVTDGTICRYVFSLEKAIIWVQNILFFIFLFVQDGKWNIGDESEGDGDDEDAEEEEDGEEEDSEAEEGDGDDYDDDDEGEEEGEEQEDSSGEEEDGHSDLDSEQESEDEEGKQENKETGAKPKKSLSKEEMKAQQEAAKAELPYTFTGNYTHKTHI